MHFSIFHISFHQKSQGFHQVRKWVTFKKLILINMFLPNKYKYILIYMSIQFKSQSRLYIQHQFLPTLFVFLLVKIYLYITTIYVEDYCYIYVVEEVHHSQGSRVKCISSGPHFLIWPQSTDWGIWAATLVKTHYLVL